MTLNDTAAAYGLFQVVFADVVDHVAIATFRLREPKEPGLQFEEVFRLRFKFEKLLRQFRQKLRQFDEGSAVADDVREVLDACDTIERLRVWRNDRIHARVRMTDGGYALYSRTGQRLEINHDQIMENIGLALKANTTLETNIQHLVGQLQFDEEFERLFSTLPEFSEPDDDGAEPATA